METAIIGIGNILLKDDGIGIYTIKELEKYSLPSNIELVDGGTSTLDMLKYFMDFKNIIIVDSLRGGNTPGTVYKLIPEDIKNYKKENLSIHDVQILDVIKIANLMGYNPRVTIYGIEPNDIRLGMEISDLLISKIPIIIKHIQTSIAEFDI